MLSRTADDLFWLSRYVERVENLARLVEVGYRIALLPGQVNGHREEWRSTLISAGRQSDFEERYDVYDTDTVVQYMLFDRENPSSIFSCLETARNKARSVRTALTREMWEILNQTWIELQDAGSDTISPQKLPQFLDWVRQRSHLFRGALLGTILRNDTFFFSQLGAFIERADNTARILDVKYYVLLPEHENVGGDIDNYQWTTILRSVSAHRSYRWVYNQDYQSWRIAEFLILRREMPRSLAFCYARILESLNLLSEFYGERGACCKLAEEIKETLSSQGIDDIFQSGLHEFLMAFIAQNNTLSDTISEDYHFHK